VSDHLEVGVAPTVELLLPFYGDAGQLREAVDSILAQDDPHWRLTVIDDAYPDPTAAAWIGELDDERVRLLRNETNLGVSGSFQRCVNIFLFKKNTLLKLSHTQTRSSPKSTMSPDHSSHALPRSAFPSSICAFHIPTPDAIAAGVMGSYGRPLRSSCATSVPTRSVRAAACSSNNAASFAARAAAFAGLASSCAALDAAAA